MTLDDDAAEFAEGDLEDGCLDDFVPVSRWILRA